MKKLLALILAVSHAAAAHAQSYTCEFPDDPDSIVFVRTESKAIYNHRSRITGEVATVEMACGDNVCAIRQNGNIQEYTLSHHVLFNAELTEVVSSFVGLHFRDETQHIFDTTTYRIECK